MFVWSLKLKYILCVLVFVHKADYLRLILIFYSHFKPFRVYILAIIPPPFRLPPPFSPKIISNVFLNALLPDVHIVVLENKSFGIGGKLLK